MCVCEYLHILIKVMNAYLIDIHTMKRESEGLQLYVGLMH